MTAYVYREFLLSVRFFWYGALLVLIYDIFRIRRTLHRGGKVWTAVEDLGFWIFTAVYVYTRCYQDNSGILRFYFVCAMCMGAGVCKKSVSRLFTKIIIFICRKVAAIGRIPVRFVRKVIKRLKFHWFRVTISLYRFMNGIGGRQKLPRQYKGEWHEKKEKRQKNASKEKI